MEPTRCRWPALATAPRRRGRSAPVARRAPGADRARRRRSCRGRRQAAELRPTARAVVACRPAGRAVDRASFGRAWNRSMRTCPRCRSTLRACWAALPPGSRRGRHGTPRRRRRRRPESKQPSAQLIADRDDALAALEEWRLGDNTRAALGSLSAVADAMQQVPGYWQSLSNQARLVVDTHRRPARARRPRFPGYLGGPRVALAGGSAPARRSRHASRQREQPAQRHRGAGRGDHAR